MNQSIQNPYAFARPPGPAGYGLGAQSQEASSNTFGDDARVLVGNVDDYNNRLSYHVHGNNYNRYNSFQLIVPGAVPGTSQDDWARPFQEANTVVSYKGLQVSRRKRYVWVREGDTFRELTRTYEVAGEIRDNVEEASRLLGRMFDLFDD
ncbi:hypothetical protein PG995_002760 [Apiospora arundinis]